jgi:hypothetical protein
VLGYFDVMSADLRALGKTTKAIDIQVVQRLDRGVLFDPRMRRAADHHAQVKRRRESTE